MRKGRGERGKENSAEEKAADTDRGGPLPLTSFSPGCARACVCASVCACVCERAYSWRLGTPLRAGHRRRAGACVCARMRACVCVRELLSHTEHSSPLESHSCRLASRRSAAQTLSAGSAPSPPLSTSQPRPLRHQPHQAPCQPA